MKRAAIGPESFGIVVCRFVGTVSDILGLVWPSFRPKSGSESQTSGRIFKSLGARPGLAQYILFRSHFGSNAACTTLLP